MRSLVKTYRSSPNSPERVAIVIDLKNDGLFNDFASKVREVADREIGDSRLLQLGKAFSNMSDYSPEELEEVYRVSGGNVKLGMVCKIGKCREQSLALHVIAAEERIVTAVEKGVLTKRPDFIPEEDFPDGSVRGHAWVKEISTGKIYDPVLGVFDIDAEKYYKIFGINTRDSRDVSPFNQNEISGVVKKRFFRLPFISAVSGVGVLATAQLTKDVYCAENPDNFVCQFGGQMSTADASGPLYPLSDVAISKSINTVFPKAKLDKKYYDPLLLALFMQESSLDATKGVPEEDKDKTKKDDNKPKKTSSALGLGQITESTAKDIAKDLNIKDGSYNLSDPNQNARFTSYYLNENFDKVKKAIPEADYPTQKAIGLACYYRGIGQSCDAFINGYRELKQKKSGGNFSFDEIVDAAIASNKIVLNTNAKESPQNASDNIKLLVSNINLYEAQFATAFYRSKNSKDLEKRLGRIGRKNGAVDFYLEEAAYALKLMSNPFNIK